MWNGGLSPGLKFLLKLGLGLLQHKRACASPVDLVKKQILIQESQGGAWEPAFLTSPQV